jgi:hypothetical protein
LKTLQQPVNDLPKKMAAWQYYLKQHSDEVSELVAAEKDYEENKNKPTIQLCSEIARRLFNEAEEVVKVKVATAVNADFKDAKNKCQHLSKAPVMNLLVQAK